MADILFPQYPSESFDGWVSFELILPNGYRHVAVVERPNGEPWDLGQNAEGTFRLFRRATGELENSHVGRGEPLSSVDLAGFGLTRDQSPYLPGDLEDEGMYSSLNRSNLIK